MDTKNVTVGQQVGIRSYGSYESQVDLGWTVTRVTPSGQVVVTKTVNYPAPGTLSTRRFDKRLREIGRSSSWRSAPELELNLETVARQQVSRHSKIEAIKAISAVQESFANIGRMTHHCSKTHFVAVQETLERLVAESRKAIDAIQE